MNERHLVYLLEIAERGSLSGAAATLGIDQPSLSRHVKQMEVDLGGALFHRTGRGVRPTSIGELFIDIARRYVEDMADLRQRVDSEREQPQGTVVLGVVQFFGDAFVPACLLKYRATRPNVVVHVTGGSSSIIQEMLLAGRIDLGLVYDAGRSNDLIAEPIMTDKLCLYSTRPVRESAGGLGVVPFHALAGLPLVLPARQHGLRRAIEHAARLAGVTLSVLYEVDSLITTKAMVRSGDCAAILPFGALGGELAHPNRHLFKIVEPEVDAVFSLATARNRKGGRAATEFIAFIRREMKGFSQDIQRTMRVHLGEERAAGTSLPPAGVMRTMP